MTSDNLPGVRRKLVEINGDVLAILGELDVNAERMAADSYGPNGHGMSPYGIRGDVARLCHAISVRLGVLRYEVYRDDRSDAP